MKPLLVFVLLVLAAGVQAQDFLGRWNVVRVFTTANLDKDVDNRMMLLINHGPKGDSRVEGVVLPLRTQVEFSINPGNKAQHVTLTSDGLLLMSLNWKARSPDGETPDLYDQTLKVWSVDEAEYGIYSILFNDAGTLVFSDRSRSGSKYLDIYQLERAE